MRVKAFAVACGVVVFALFAVPGKAQTDNLKAQHAQTQKQRQQLQEKVKKIKKDIERTQTQRDDVREQLRTVESAISQKARTLDKLNKDLATQQARLNKLQAEQIDKDREKKQLQEHLAQQLRAQYAGGLSPWVALLLGENPQGVQRELHYLGYVAQAQADKVAQLNEILAQIQQLQENSLEAQREISAIQKETQKEQQALEKHFAHHEKVLAQIEHTLEKQRRQAKQHQEDAQRLTSLIDGLEAEITAQRKAQRAAQEKAARALAKKQQEQAKQARIRAEQEADKLRAEAKQARELLQEAKRRQALVRQQEGEPSDQSPMSPAEQLTPDKGLTFTQGPTLEQLEAQAKAAAQKAEQAQQQAEKQQAKAKAASSADEQVPIVFSGLQKGAPMPAKGRIQGRFGAERPDGGTWRGVVIQANEGSPAQAIADGEVVYSDWLSGFGNLLIIDHGENFLTIYGYNQSLLKEVGERVRTGEVVAHIGATGGQVEPGLYFEIRHQGQPVNPQLWLQAP